MLVGKWNLDTSPDRSSCQVDGGVSVALGLTPLRA